jgi:hypothetical protein
MAHARWSQIHSSVQYLAIITGKFLRHAVGVPRAKNPPEGKRVEQARVTDPAYHRDISLFFQEKNVQDGAYMPEDLSPWGVKEQSEDVAWS